MVNLTQDYQFKDYLIVELGVAQKEVTPSMLQYLFKNMGSLMKVANTTMVLTHKSKFVLDQVIVDIALGPYINLDARNQKITKDGKFLIMDFSLAKQI